jgi:choline-sulfatase
MNIVIVVADQLSFRGVRAYGGRAELPAIDRFFALGTGFQQAYTPCPLCMPARAAFWSGTWPHTTGVLSNGRAFEQSDVPTNLPALGETFAAAGYECVHFGKEHDAGALRGFTRMPQQSAPVEPEPGYPVNEDTFRDRGTAEQACSWFAERGDSRPLRAVIDFNNPHNICGWVGEMARHVSGADTRLPSDLPDLPPNFNDHDLHTRPRSVQYQCCAHNRLAQTQGWKEIHYRLYLDAYEHYSRLAEAEIACVLEAAERTLPAKETIDVFFADHGDAMTAHRGVTKHTTFYEETTRVPFAVMGPGRPAGRMTDGPVSLLDLFPTLCDLAGVNVPEQTRRQLAAVLLADRLRGAADDAARSAASPGARHVVPEWHTEWGFTIEPGRVITDGRWKYMTYAEGGDEKIYDLARDPYEARNLVPAAGDAPEVAGDLSRMRDALREHVDLTNDPFFSLEAVVHSPLAIA